MVPAATRAARYGGTLFPCARGGCGREPALADLFQRGTFAANGRQKWKIRVGVLPELEQPIVGRSRAGGVAGGGAGAAEVDERHRLDRRRRRWGGALDETLEL